MIGKFNKLNGSEQDFELVPNVVPDGFAVAPEIDSTEQLRVEIDDTDESRPVRYTSDVRLIIHIKDLASRAGTALASKFGQSKSSASQIQQMMDTMTDNDLLSMVRSRHVQSPSEIIAWSKQLSAYAENFESHAKELIDIESAKQKVDAAAAASVKSTSTE